jgi:Sec-independent protein translocase protein TatA
MAARVAGLWIRKARRVVADTKAEINREIGLKDVRRFRQHRLCEFQIGSWQFK